MTYLQAYDTEKYKPYIFKTPLFWTWVFIYGHRTLYSTCPANLGPKIEVKIHAKHVHFTVKQYLLLSVAKQCESQRSMKQPSQQKCALTLSAIITISELRRYTQRLTLQPNWAMCRSRLMEVFQGPRSLFWRPLVRPSPSPTYRHPSWNQDLTLWIQLTAVNTLIK